MKIALRDQRRKNDDVRCVGFYSMAKCSIGHSEIFILQILIFFFLCVDSAQRVASIACESVRHSGSDIHCTGEHGLRVL